MATKFAPVLLFLDYASGAPVSIAANTALTALREMTAEETASGFPGTAIDIEGEDTFVRGDLAYVRGVIVAAQSTVISSERYTPVITSSGAGVVEAQGDFFATRIGNVVRVTGVFNFTAAAAGVAETLSMTLPADAQPTAVFADGTQLRGSCKPAGVVAATVGAGAITSQVAARKADVILTWPAGKTGACVDFAYQIAA